jgi:Ca2+-transporting ATPase
MISFAVLLLSKEIAIFGDDSFLKNHTKQESLTFAVLVMGHLVQSFLSKSVFNSIFTTGVTNNIWMIIAFISSSGLLAIGIEAPVIQGWLEFTGIGGTGWAVVFISAAVQVCIIELVKLIFRYLSKK